MHIRDEKPPSDQLWRSVVLALVVFCVAGLSLSYVYRTREQTRDLAAANQTLTASVVQLQNQLQSITEQLKEQRNPPVVASPITAKSAQTRPSTKARPARKTRAASPRVVRDPRVDRMESQLTDQQAALAKTREDLDQTRGDLETQLHSSHDELSGSIARTHSELVALQKRGERNYYEFDLPKSKQMQHVGPMSLTLRGTNAKRKSYNLEMLIDDSKIQKKNANLFEPVWINLADRSERIELVVNQVGKDRIRGYISEPKYKGSDLKATAASSPAALNSR